MKKYAQIDKNNICFATANLTDDIAAPDKWIPIKNCDDVLGKVYSNGIWEDVPQPEPEPLPMPEQTILDIAINSEYLVCLADLNL